MVEKKIPGLGTFSFPDDPPPQRTRPSLFPTREQVASLRGLPLPPPPRNVPQPPQPNVTTTAQEADPDAAAAESSDVDRRRSSMLKSTRTTSVSRLTVATYIRAILIILQPPISLRLQLLNTLRPSVLPPFLAQKATRLRLAGHHSHRSLHRPSSPLRTAVLMTMFLPSSYQVLSQLSTHPSLQPLCFLRLSALQLVHARKATTLCQTHHHSHRSLRQSSLPPRTLMLA